MVKRNSPDLHKVRISQTPLTEKAAMETKENMLLAEIEFWRYMIESRRGTISEQASERMRLACELAERKLMMMVCTSPRIDTRQ
jgi:hypothetical protein